MIIELYLNLSKSAAMGITNLKLMQKSFIVVCYLCYIFHIQDI